MKNMMAALAALLLCVAPARSQSFNELWDKANTAYVNGDYDRAVSYYDSIRLAGLSSAKLYYNLGNAHFKQGHVGEAILNFNRAHRLSPSDDDINYNLRMANAMAKDRIESVPGFFLYDWARDVQRSVGADLWAVIGLVALALAVPALLLYLLSESLLRRKVGFYTALAGVVVFAVSLASGLAERRGILHSADAVVMRQAEAVKSSPDGGSKDIFILHEGTVVRMVGTLDDWTEITISDGRKGWLRSSSIEKI